MANNGYYLTAYEMAVNHGFTGTKEQWIAMLCGNFDKLTDHTTMTNRDADDQHPISAISGLQEWMNRIEDTVAESAVASEWINCILAPVMIINNQETTIQTSTESDLVQTVNLPSEIDISSGIWEMELYVIGMRMPDAGTQDAPKACITVGLCDRTVGTDETNRYDLFSVKSTQLQTVDQCSVVSHHAILHNGHRSVSYAGMVGGAYEGGCYQDFTKEANRNTFVNTAVIRAVKGAYSYATHGIILRYRKIAEE